MFWYTFSPPSSSEQLKVDHVGVKERFIHCSSCDGNVEHHYSRIMTTFQNTIKPSVIAKVSVRDTCIGGRTNGEA